LYHLQTVAVIYLLLFVIIAVTGISLKKWQ